MRRDAWWAQPLVTFVVLGAFVVYATWAAFQGEHYEFGPYLSPFYSPLLFGDGPHSWFGPQAGLVAGCAAVLGGAADPLGAGRFPLHLLLLPRRLLQGVLGRSAVLRGRRAAQKLSRRAIVPADPPEHPPLLPVSRAAVPRSSSAHDVWKAMWFTDPATGQTTFGIGVGTLVLAVNTVLLSGYTLGCHSLPPPRRRLPRSVLEAPDASSKLYDAACCLNCRHSVGRGSACSRSRSPISTSASARWAS